MIEIKTKLRKWGNSLGILVPFSKINDDKIHEGDSIDVFMKKEKRKNVLEETFGTLKSRKSTDKIMKEIDKELDIDF